jgi:hypothetical protein
MSRRSLNLAVALALAITALAVPAVSAHSFPARIDLPSGWSPEGITAGRGNTIYVGSLAGGGVWKGDVRTGTGDVLVEPWGGPAVGVEYDRRNHRLWVAGGPTGTVRVYDARTGDLLEQYTFAPAGFLNDLVVTRRAVYVTDSRNPWLNVIPLGRHGALPDPADVERLDLTGIPFEADQINANGIVAARGWLIVVDSFDGGLYRVNPFTGQAKPISTGGASVAMGDGLELRGNLLVVVRNRAEVIQFFWLRPWLKSAVPIASVDADDVELSIPTTAAFQAGRLWVVNARFGIPTTEYWVTRVP